MIVFFFFCFCTEVILLLAVMRLILPLFLRIAVIKVNRRTQVQVYGFLLKLLTQAKLKGSAIPKRETGSANKHKPDKDNGIMISKRGS